MNACCAIMENRVKGAGPRGWEGLGDAQTRGDIDVTHCPVCTCRHIEATVDPATLGLEAAPIG